MSFVSLGGDGLRPTFFELVAADRLMASLKAAVVYSLSVYAQRRPSLHRLLDREDELFFLLRWGVVGSGAACLACLVWGSLEVAYLSPCLVVC